MCWAVWPRQTASLPWWQQGALTRQRSSHRHQLSRSAPKEESLKGILGELPALAGNAGPGGFGRQNSEAQEDTTVNAEGQPNMSY